MSASICAILQNCCKHLAGWEVLELGTGTAVSKCSSFHCRWIGCGMPIIVQVHASWEMLMALVWEIYWECTLEPLFSTVSKNGQLGDLERKGIGKGEARAREFDGNFSLVQRVGRMPIYGHGAGTQAALPSRSPRFSDVTISCVMLRWFSSLQPSKPNCNNATSEQLHWPSGSVFCFYKVESSLISIMQA